MKNKEIIERMNSVIQFFITQVQNLPGSEFSKNINELINLKCELSKTERIKYPTGNKAIDWLLADERNGLNEEHTTDAIRFIIDKINEL